MDKKISGKKGKTTQTKVGYIGIFTCTYYGQRNVDNGDGYANLYEGMDTCLEENKNKENFLTVGILTWEE